MKFKKNGLSYWLLPTEKSRTEIQSIINKFCSEYGTPIFEPHLTVYVGTFSDSDDFKNIISQSFNDLDPLKLEYQGAGYSEKFTMSVYLQFRSSSLLDSIFSKIASHSEFTTNYKIDPHISLIYKDLPLEEKKYLASNIQVSFNEICFDRVKVSCHRNIIDCDEAIEDFDELYVTSLS